MESSDHIKSVHPVSETIDFNKLLTIIKTNWVWIVLIFLLINSIAYLVIRYSKNLYESQSEIKLDVKSEASGFGLKNLMDDPDVNIMSGEIEVIQSKLFLNRVLDQSDFTISFISVGRLLNNELFNNGPAFVAIHSPKHSFYNTPIYFHEKSPDGFALKINGQDPEHTGKYGEQLKIGDLLLTLNRNRSFIKGDEVGYYFVINSREVLLNYLVTNLKAEPLNYNANTIRLAFKDHNPFKAQAVLNKIDSIYLLYSNEQKNLANNQKIGWLTNELGRIEKHMEDYENYFENFTLENKTNNLDDDLRKTISALNKADSQRYEYIRRLQELRRVKNDLDSGRALPPVWIRTSLPEPFIKNIEDLSMLQLQQEKIRLSYNERTFTFREKQKEIESLRARIDNQMAELSHVWSKKLTDLTRTKEQLEKAFVDFPEKNTEFSKNQRFYKLYEEFYLTLMQSKSEFEIAQAGTTPDFKILSPASFSSQPISPKKYMILGVGLVFSFVANFFFIGILYLVNNKISSLGELERLRSAPVLGAVPASKYPTGNGLHILQHPKSMVSEAVRSLRTNLDFFNILSDKKVIAISSTVSGEGKSFIAMNLGGVLALSKKRVILLDLDMRKMKTLVPGSSADNSKGISTILIRKNSWKDCVVSTELENFDIIPSGPHPPNPSELLLNGEFNDLIKGLKEEYDYVILDTPPVGLVTDGIIAMRRADISLYIFRANYSKRDFISTLNRITQLNRFSNITTILNAVPSTNKTYGYGYYEENGRSVEKIKNLVDF